MDTIAFYGKEKISKILLKLAPPVMLAQLIQALYNIIDSLFIGRFSDDGLTALSIVYPLQLLMIALAVGTGVGINTIIAAKLGEGREKEANEYAGVGTPLATVLWFLFALICWLIMPAYARMSTESETIIQDVITYGRIVCLFSFGLFLESIWTKVLQANGDMKTPMVAQIIGAVTNIILDPLLIFGMFGLPRMGIAGAAVATVAGQIVAALIVMKKGYRPSPAKAVYPRYIARIFHLGMPNILMQSAYTFYILGLNLILAGFSDQAVTALGLYYKWQTFFFIPLNAMQTCSVPIISFNYGAKNIDRVKKAFHLLLRSAACYSTLLWLLCMLVPQIFISIFTSDADLASYTIWALRIYMAASLLFAVQLACQQTFIALGNAKTSVFLALLRKVLLLIPLIFILPHFVSNPVFGVFVAEPVADTIAVATTAALFFREYKKLG